MLHGGKGRLYRDAVMAMDAAGHGNRGQRENAGVLAKLTIAEVGRVRNIAGGL